MWTSWNDDPSEDWSETIITAFAYVNAAFNLISPNAAQWLEKRGVPRKRFLALIFAVNGAVFFVMGAMAAFCSNQSYRNKVGLGELIMKLKGPTLRAWLRPPRVLCVVHLLL